MCSVFKKVIVLTLTIGLMCSCSSNSTKTNVETRQTINLVVDEQYLNALNSVLGQFETNYPDITISTNFVPPDEENKRMFYISSLNSQESQFDLYWMPSSWINEFVSKKYISNISNYIDIDRNLYSETALKLFSKDNELYSLPLFLDTWVLYYRKDKVNGLDWQSNLHNLSLPHVDEDSVIDFILSNSMINNYDFQKTIGFYKQWYTSSTRNEKSSTREFADGITNYLWAKGSSRVVLEDELSNVKGKIGISTKDENSFYISGEGLAINASADEKKKDAISKFLEFISNENIYIDFSKELMTLPVWKDLQDHQIVIDSIPFANKVFSNPENLISSQGVENEYELRQEAKEKLIYFVKGSISIKEVCDAFKVLIEN